MIRKNIAGVVGPRSRPRRRRAGVAVAAAALVGLALSACGATADPAPTADASGSAPAGITAETVTIQANAPTSLNPAVGPIGQTAALYTYLAYGALIFQTQEGEFVPDLATEWGYVEGSDNTSFTLTLRDGVTFASGAAFDAQAVADSITYFKEAGGPQSALLADLTSVEATGELTVQLDFSAPTPNLPFLFSQSQGLGAVMGPDGLADPDSLATTSDGAGPYTIDSDGVIAGSQYTYKANPAYWNPDAVHFGEVVLKSVVDENAILAGLRDGGLDIAFPSALPTIVEGARSAGLAVDGSPFGIFSLILADRDGEISPLGDVKVRRAIAHALERAPFATLIGGSQAVETNQLSVSGSAGFSEEISDVYAYDVEEAKSLLAEAGYPDGFTLRVLDAGATDRGGVIGQGIVSALSRIGIEVELKVENDFGQFIPAALGKTYPAILVPTPFFGDGFYYGSQLALQTFSNPFGATDPQLDALYAEAALAEDTAAQLGYFTQISERLVDLAWFAPLGASIQNQIHASHIAGVKPTSAAAPGIWSPFGPSPELSWWSTK